MLYYIFTVVYVSATDDVYTHKSIPVVSAEHKGVPWSNYYLHAVREELSASCLSV